MTLTIRELYETLQTLDASGLLDQTDGEVTILHQPCWPLAETATGCGWIVRDGTVELVIGANATGSAGHADGIQMQAFSGSHEELVAEEE